MTAPRALDRLLDRAQLRRAPSRPRQIHLSVTDRCFLPCLHCDIWKNEATDLPEATWADLIDRLGDWCAPAGMNFVGGEPLLRRDLERLMARAVARGFEVSFNTNGWLLTAARARALHEAGVSTAYVSLDGATAATVDHSRGKPGSYDKALAALDLLQAHGSPRVVIATVLHAGNAAEVDELLRLVTARGLQLVVQPLYQNFGYNTYDPTWWRSSPLFPKDEAALARVDAALDRLTAERLRGGPVQNEPAQLQAMKGHFRAPEADNGQMCRAGHSDLSFDPEGRVRLCYFLEPVGTIFDPTPLPLLWDGWTALRRRWEVSRCERHCNLLNCNFGG
jgi:MoaA/NifB/PqqE/SkfB family radical SAM enzyme